MSGGSAISWDGMVSPKADTFGTFVYFDSFCVSKKRFCTTPFMLQYSLSFRTRGISAVQAAVQGPSLITPNS
jgi:hypothetical protein